MSRLAALLALMLLLPAAAIAHTVSESNSTWEISGSSVNLVLTIPITEASRVTRDGSAPDDAALIAYLTPKVFPLTDGKPCALVPPVEMMRSTPVVRKVDFTFKCPSPNNIEIHSAAFFDLIDTHTNYAVIQNAATGEFTQQLITKDNQTAAVTSESGALQQASFADFVIMGVEHIIFGIDHMAFLIGLVLISQRMRDLVFVVTGFTIGHSLTLALAVTGLVRPHPEFIDALVALTIALIGAENLAVATKRPEPIALFVGLCAIVMIGLKLLGVGTLPLLLILGAGLFCTNYLMVSGHVREAGKLRMVITVVFGLIHGFGFAASLLEMQLPPERLGELLIGFNLGVELGQLALVIAVTLIAALLVRIRLAPPRAIVVETTAACLVAMGVFWFVERSFA